MKIGQNINLKIVMLRALNVNFKFELIKTPLLYFLNYSINKQILFLKSKVK